RLAARYASIRCFSLRLPDTDNATPPTTSAATPPITARPLASLSAALAFSLPSLARLLGLTRSMISSKVVAGPSRALALSPSMLSYLLDTRPPSIARHAARRGFWTPTTLLHAHAIRARVPAHPIGWSPIARR